MRFFTAGACWSSGLQTDGGGTVATAGTLEAKVVCRVSPVASDHAFAGVSQHQDEVVLVTEAPLGADLAADSAGKILSVKARRTL